MITAIAEERERLLPRIERDQRELAAAIGDLQTASAESGKRAALWILAGLVLVVGVRLALRRLF